jgi:hypothetical protein
LSERLSQAAVDPSANQRGRAERTITQMSRTQATRKVERCRIDLLSAPPLRSLRLGGECISIVIHRRDAEVAEITQRKTEAGNVMSEVIFVATDALDDYEARF